MPRTPRLSLAAGSVRASVFAELQPHIDAYRARGGRLIPLQIGDTSWSPPARARFSAVAEGDHADPALYRYGALNPEADLIERIEAQLAARGVPLPDGGAAHNVLVGCGATHAIFCAARVMLDPGDDVLVAAPYWPLVPGLLAACGARAVEVPLTQALYADPNADAGRAFAVAVTPRTTAIYVISPNNPDGKVLSPAQLDAIARVARENDLWVLSDEVYADFAFDAEHVAMATRPGMAERTVTAYSLSKSHALAGARIGYVVGPGSLVAAARRIANHTVYNTPVIAQRAAARALAEDAAYLDGIRNACREARDVALAGLRGSDAHFYAPEGGAYVFLDFAPLLRDRPLRVLLERAIDHGVLLAPGDAFGQSFQRWARLCYTGVDIASLREGIERLRTAMASLD